jgi:hypothetical protein
MEKYSAMAMYDGVIPEHRDVFLAVEAQAEIDRLNKLYDDRFKETGGLLAREELCRTIDAKQAEIDELVRWIEIIGAYIPPEFVKTRKKNDELIAKHRKGE